MNYRPANAIPGHSREPRPVDNFRTLSIKILHYANLGVSRIGFLRQVSKIILDFSACDALSIQAADGELYYCSRATRRPSRTFNFEILNPDDDAGLSPGACTLSNERLDDLVRDVMLSRQDCSSPLFTSNGSLWISDVENPRVSRRDDDDDQSSPIGPFESEYKSLLVIPFVVSKENNGVLILQSMEKFFFTENEVALFETIAQTLGMAIASRRSRYDCSERVKELTCFYGIGRIAGRKGLSMDEMLLLISGLIPPAWQYPEITSGRIVLDDSSYATFGFKESRWSQKADFVIDDQVRGFIEVVYSEERPNLYEGPFLKEERNLLDALAVEVAQLIKKREYEESQSVLQEQLRHADRLATLGQLAAGIAHELNEPLGAILGFAQLISRDRDIPGQVRDDIDKIVHASLHSREIVKKLLLFARQLPTHKTRVNLNTMIRDGLYFLETRCDTEDIHLVRDLDPDAPEILADPAQIQQVLVNLIVNAIQAMPDGGKLTLRTIAGDDHVKLIVSDTGCGMTEEVLGRIFVPFYTTKDVGQGTGLGLAVVHGIVTAHKGTISVTSTPGRGSEFTVSFPAYNPDNDEEPEDYV